MQVYDTAMLGGQDHFTAEIAGLCSFVRSCPRIDGVDEILLPGDPERRALRQRTAEGIPLDEGNWRALVELAGKLGVRVPGL